MRKSRWTGTLLSCTYSKVPYIHSVAILHIILSVSDIVRFVMDGVGLAVIA